MFLSDNKKNRASLFYFVQAGPFDGHFVPLAQTRVKSTMAVESLSKSREESSSSRINQLFDSLAAFSRRCLFRILRVGPIPDHFAFIMDGNRRYAKRRGREEGAGHKAGFLSLMSVLRYCYELGVKYVTAYAFSIDNFKRKPDEVQSLMDLMLEKIELLLEKESIVDEYGVRVYFIGNLKLLSEPVRAAADKLMEVTSKNSRAVLLVCVAYTSSNEIVYAVQESCRQKLGDIQASTVRKFCNDVIKEVENTEKVNGVIMPENQESCNGIHDASQESREIQVKELREDGSGEVQTTKPEKIVANESKTYEENLMQEQGHVIHLVDIEKNMRMAVAPNPDALIRSSGETRLSNFLLWQTSCCPLYSPSALWPEIGLRHLVWAILNFQRSYSYLEKKKKQL